MQIIPDKQLRNFKFRGRQPSCYHWLFGFLVEQYGCKSAKLPRRYIISYNKEKSNYDWENPCHVDCETVGQFTGLFDKNVKEIFEDDIIEYYGKNFIVVFKAPTFLLKSDSGVFSELSDEIAAKSIVIDNIHDFCLKNHHTVCYYSDKQIRRMTEKQKAFISDLEKELGCNYGGGDNKIAASKWISEHIQDYRNYLQQRQLDYEAYLESLHIDEGGEGGHWD